PPRGNGVVYGRPSYDRRHPLASVLACGRRRYVRYAASSILRYTTRKSSDALPVAGRAQCNAYCHETSHIVLVILPAQGRHHARPSAGPRRMLRSVVRLGLTGLGLLLLGMLLINGWLMASTQDRIHDRIEQIGDFKVGLVLGTSPYTSSGAKNLLFRHRMRTAAQLYADGKVQHLLVSGANPGNYYNEPQKM